MSALSLRAALIITLLTAAAMLPGCGGEEGAAENTGIIEQRGSIGSGDSTDPDHMNLPYDGFTFRAEPLDSVALVVSADGFVPMLKLMEVSTGAVLAEWDSEYADADHLSYITASPGSYEARVYATCGGEGDYTLTISISN
ncbi:MAG: hypothetical protein R6U39_00290 [Candidatus Aegiribacteria sp.]